jgi:hypothetical protein
MSEWAMTKASSRWRNRALNGTATPPGQVDREEDVTARLEAGRQEPADQCGGAIMQLAVGDLAVRERDERVIRALGCPAQQQRCQGLVHGNRLVFYQPAVRLASRRL